LSDIQNIKKQVKQLESEYRLSSPGGLSSGFDTKSEAEVWNLFKGGDQSAFIFIYNKYFHILFNYGRQFTGNIDLIKDCIHDIFYQIRSGQAISKTTNIKFYLLKSFKNRYLYYLKRNHKYDLKPSEDQGYAFEVSLSQEQIIINEQIDREQKSKLIAALDQLSKRQKEAVYYYYYQDLSVDEISDLMNLNHRRSVQNLIYEAIHQLKNVLLSILIASTLLF